MKRILLTTLAAGIFAQPSDLSAQLFYNGIPDAQEYLYFVKGSGVNGGYGVQVGPYVGRFAGDPTTAQFSIYCVDYNHYAISQWVNVTSLGTPVGSMDETRLDDYTKYRQAAYLSSLFDTAPTSAWGSIHAAIWYITSGVSVGSSSGRQYYLNLAYQNAGSFNTNGWYVLSPLNEEGGPFDGTGQEFLMRTRVSVPEPAALLLLATGLVLLAAASRARRRALESAGLSP